MSKTSVGIKGEIKQPRGFTAQQGSDLIDQFLRWCKDEDLEFQGSMFIPAGKYGVKRG